MRAGRGAERELLSSFVHFRGVLARRPFTSYPRVVARDTKNSRHVPAPGTAEQNARLQEHKTQHTALALWIAGGGRRPSFFWVAHNCFIRFLDRIYGVLLVNSWHFTVFSYVLPALIPVYTTFKERWAPTWAEPTFVF